MIKDLLEQLKSKIESPLGGRAENEDTNSPITQLTTDKLKAIVADLTNAAPIFDEAGFIMEQLEVEVGLLPKIIPQFVQKKKITKELESALLEQLNDRKLLKFVLQSLFKSSRMEALMENTELSLYGIEIEISAPPSVRTIFRRQVNITASAESSDIVTSPQDMTQH